MIIVKLRVIIHSEGREKIKFYYFGAIFPFLREGFKQTKKNWKIPLSREMPARPDIPFRKKPA